MANMSQLIVGGGHNDYYKIMLHLYYNIVSSIVWLLSPPQR